MNIFKFIRLLWKTMWRTLSIEEFSYLLNAGEEKLLEKHSPDTKKARMLLRFFFRRPLRQEELDILMQPSYQRAQDDWLRSMAHREAGEEEMEYLAGRLPWHTLRLFPFELPKDGLRLLFAGRNPKKIARYCSQYPLPEEYEVTLINNYVASLTVADQKMTYFTAFGHEPVNGWKRALSNYLGGCDPLGKRLQTKTVQKMILDLHDDGLIKDLVSSCNIANNRLDHDVIWNLIKENKVEAMRLLLRESYVIASSALFDFLEKQMPQLVPQYYIALYRHNVYLQEQRDHVFLGALGFSAREMRFVERGCFTDSADPTEIEWLLPTFGPCMLAHIAYHCPQFAEKISKIVSERQGL